MKKCSKCNIEKDISLFNKKHGKPQSICKECHSMYRKKHYEQNKEKYIYKSFINRNKYRQDYYNWLLKQKCKDCGNNDIRVLEQDHLYDKNFNIAKMVGSISFESLLLELEKCETVCANCHRIRTSKRGKWKRSEMFDSGQSLQ